MGAFENSNVLIVGGAGFVGSNLARLLLQQNGQLNVLVVDNFLSSEPENVPSDARVNLMRGSIADDKILAEISDSFDYIFHLATYHGNQSSIHDPLKDHENNTVTTLKLMNHAKNFKCLKKLVYSAAGCSAAKKTYAEAEETTEEAPISVVQDSPYSISKVIGEFYSVYFHKQHGLPTVRARFQNVYGPGEVLGAGEWRGTPATVWRNVTPTFIYRALNGQTMQLHNGGDASRDFIYVDDICEGLMACALKGKPGDVYNLASGKEMTIRDWAQTIISLSGNKAELELLPKRDWDTSGKRFGSPKKANQELGFSAVTSIEEGLRKTIAWTKENLPFIETCMEKHSGRMTVHGP